MRVTRVIAVSVILASIGLTALNAQTLRNAAPPAEFPPASYKGKQYVDSNGCIYIRAGIDGNVTWVPRVSRQRKQICGYKPSLAAGAGATAKPAPTQAPTVITLDPAQRPPQTAAKAAPKANAKTPAKPAAAPKVKTTASTAAKPVQTTAAPKPVVKPAPPAVRTTRTTTARPPVTTTRRPMPTVASTAPVRAPAQTAAPVVAPRQAPAAPATSAGGCSNASAFSQQFINKKGVRCGPQTEAPVTYGQGWRKDSALGGVGPNDRVVPRHVYDNRQNTRNVSVPSGYRPVWKDDRLNPYRAERTPAPSVVTAGASVPAGFRQVARDDDRLNTRRATLTAGGDAQTDAIWTRTIPRTLKPVPTDRPVVTISGAGRSSAEAVEPYYLRLSTRSVPGAVLPAGVPTRPTLQGSR